MSSKPSFPERDITGLSSQVGGKGPWEQQRVQPGSLICGSAVGKAEQDGAPGGLRAPTPDLGGPNAWGRERPGARIQSSLGLRWRAIWGEGEACKCDSEGTRNVISSEEKLSEDHSPQPPPGLQISSITSSQHWPLQIYPTIQKFAFCHLAFTKD